ncbi:MAG: HD domain-containing protein [Spirochaetaceae bacterium]|nr:HD domain-containing protein [Spirochaetaceae bacterium]
MNSFNVSDLQEKNYFSEEVNLDKNFLLLTNILPVTNELLSLLKEWKFKTIFSEGIITSAPAAIKLTTETNSSNTLSPADFPIDADGNPSYISSNLKNALDEVSNTSDAEDENAKLKSVENAYNEFLTYTNTIYTRFATHKELNINTISETIRELCFFVKENKQYVLRINTAVEANDKSFLIHHSLRSTILAIVIGVQFNFDNSKLLELGIACILHEIGMIRLPPQLYITDKILKPNEKKILFTHPALSYNILKNYAFPLNICLGVLEHHEKENGKGYPRRITSKQISSYAKIISVACSYEAITAKRTYKDSKTNHDAIVELLKNESKQYDDSVIKALLFSLSLYPIGSFVFLSNGKLAQVTDVNPENPKNPVVQIINFQNREPEKIFTSEDDIKVMRALSKEEARDILEVQKKQQES